MAEDNPVAGSASTPPNPPRYRRRPDIDPGSADLLPRDQKKACKKAMRDGDQQAIRRLLAHSVAMKQSRLAFRRYLSARFRGVDDIADFVEFCRPVFYNLGAAAALSAATAIARNLHVEVDIHQVLSELTRPTPPLILPFGGVSPQLASSPRYCGANVSLLGRVEIGANAWFGPASVIRGDGHFVRIGDDFRLGERGTVHIAHELYPVIIGHRVVAGANAVVHACVVGDDCVIEDGSTILDAAILEPGVVVEAGSTVYPRAELKRGWLYGGSPAIAVRELEEGELDRRRQAVCDRLFTAIVDRVDDRWQRPDQLGGELLLCETTQMEGAIEVGDGASIFFGCRFDAGQNAIVIGADYNIQDNTIICAENGDVTIGAKTTIGHNVNLSACTIGRHALIGIGSTLGEGTVVEDDVLLAGGSTTLPGQILTEGWLWGGRPARAIAPLDDKKRAMMARTIIHYRFYAQEYAAAQQARRKKES